MFAALREKWNADEADVRYAHGDGTRMTRMGLIRTDVRYAHGDGTRKDMFKGNRNFFIVLTLLFALVGSKCGQTYKGRIVLGKENAEKELHLALENEKQHNVVNGKDPIIPDSASAINIAETILFKIYGKDDIKRQRPYEIYLIDNYWIILGTLPEESFGGTFLIIMDSRDSKVIKVTHGK